MLYRKVIHCTPNGRVVLIKNFTSDEHFALKYFYRWRFENKYNDELFLAAAEKTKDFVINSKIISSLLKLIH